MAPLIVLVVVSLLARGVGALGVGYLGSWSAAVAVGLAVMLVMTATTHFVPPRRAGMIAIVPPRLPAPALIITVTGLLEYAGAIGLLIPPLRLAAAICVGLLFIAMFPANVFAAGEKRHPAAPSTPLGRRAAIQLVFLGACVVVALAI